MHEHEIDENDQGAEEVQPARRKKRRRKVEPSKQAEPAKRKSVVGREVSAEYFAKLRLGRG